LNLESSANAAMAHAPKKPAAGVLSVVLAYALVAGLWILLSDRAAAMLFRDPEALVWASTAKGWFFVGVTSLLLYVLVRRHTSALVAAHERELAHEREREQPPPMLVAIADAYSDAIYAKDEADRYLLFNNAAARFVGKPADAVLDQDDRALFPSAQAEGLMARDRALRASGQAETHEETLPSTDGDRVLLTTKGPLRNADGKVFGTYGISRNITERKLAEDALRLLADDLSATLQAIPDLMFEVDTEGRTLKVKSLNNALLAAPPEQFLGRTVGDVLPAEAADGVMQALASAGRAGSDFGRTITLPPATGAHHFELSVARKPMVAGQQERFIVLSRDITARKAAEAKLRQRNQELEHFNRAATERELRMVALKAEVNELARAVGRPAPYDISFADASASRAAP
jgi:PAS domain S-box-containing protein